VLSEPDDINELMDWEAIEHLLGDIHAKRRGNDVHGACVYVQSVITAGLV
jgi:hypothetical protein